MMHKIIPLYICFTLLGYHITVFSQTSKVEKPAIQQAKNYKPVDDIRQYWLSEKLDGIRGYWNGEKLLTRQGNLIYTPNWFTEGWPETPIDGELWQGRDKFQQTLSCVSKKKVNEQCWQNITFMIFDLPKHQGTFTIRINAMEALVNKADSAYLAMVEQFKLNNMVAVEKKLDSIIAIKGEGLMLHHADSHYYAGRTARIMKMKKAQDAEAIVIAHIEGKGKYQGMLGAIRVKTDSGITFKIGSGFSDKDRQNPPKIGSTISYKYNGTTQANIPRFARYWRPRNIASENL